MATETEFKFTVNKDLLPSLSDALFRPINIKQFYLSVGDSYSPEVRVRIEDGVNYHHAEMTIKSAVADYVRKEVSIPIEPEKVEDLLEMKVGHIIEKTRYLFTMTGAHSPQLAGKTLWEIDIYKGANEGLIIAEFEIPRNFETAYSFTPPAWVLEDVTRMPKYKNSHLALTPFVRW